MTYLTDTHCHLNLNQFNKDLDQVLLRAFAAGVGKILIPGIDLPTSRLAVDICEQDDRLFAAVGLHPTSALHWHADQMSEWRDLIQHPRVVAVGEIGLDYYRDNSPPEIQQQVLEQMLILASEAHKPVVIHNRLAWHHLWPRLSAWQQSLQEKGSTLAAHPGVLHSFDGDAELAQKAFQQHFFLGVSGPVTFSNAKDRQILVASLPLTQILLETDSPYLTPHPHRGKRNEPAYVRLIAEKVAFLHHRSYEEILAVTAQNADSLFSWRSAD